MSSLCFNQSNKSQSKSNLCFNQWLWIQNWLFVLLDVCIFTFLKWRSVGVDDDNWFWFLFSFSFFKKKKRLGHKVYATCKFNPFSWYVTQLYWIGSSGSSQKTGSFSFSSLLNVAVKLIALTVAVGLLLTFSLHTHKCTETSGERWREYQMAHCPVWRRLIKMCVLYWRFTLYVCTGLHYHRCSFSPSLMLLFYLVVHTQDLGRG